MGIRTNLYNHQDLEKSHKSYVGFAFVSLLYFCISLHYYYYFAFRKLEMIFSAKFRRSVLYLKFQIKGL